MTINLQKAFNQKPEPLDMVLPGLLRGTVGILTSAGGVGKSFLMMQAAMGVVSKGADLTGLGEGFTLGNVLILNAEDQASIIESRLFSIGARLSPEAKEALYNGLIIEDWYGQGCDVMSLEWKERIIELAKDNNCRLIVLDTLSRWHRLDENSNGDMGRVMAQLECIAKESGAAVVILHHVAKGMAKDGRSDEQQSARGASLLVDNARWQAFLVGMTESEAEQFDIIESMRGFYVRFGVSKNNYGRPFESRWFERKEGGVLLPAELVGKEKKGSKAGAKKSYAEASGSSTKKGASDEAAKIVWE